MVYTKKGVLLQKLLTLQEDKVRSQKYMLKMGEIGQKWGSIIKM